MEESIYGTNTTTLDDGQVQNWRSLHFYVDSAQEVQYAGWTLSFDSVQCAKEFKKARPIYETDRDAIAPPGEQLCVMGLKAVNDSNKADNFGLSNAMMLASDGNYYSVAGTEDPYFASTRHFAQVKNQPTSEGEDGAIDPGKTAYFYELAALPVDVEPVALENDVWVDAEEDTSGIQ